MITTQSAFFLAGSHLRGVGWRDWLLAASVPLLPFPKCDANHFTFEPIKLRGLCGSPVCGVIHR
jgi:hypothetical protein